MPVYDPALRGFGDLASALLIAPQMARQRRMEEEDRAARKQAQESALAQALTIHNEGLEQRKAERDEQRRQFQVQENRLSAAGTAKADQKKPVPPGVFSSMRDALLAKELAQGDRLEDKRTGRVSYREGYDPAKGLQFGMVQEGIDPHSGLPLDEEGMLRESLRIHPIEDANVNEREMAILAQEQAVKPMPVAADPGAAGAGIGGVGQALSRSPAKIGGKGKPSQARKTAAQPSVGARQGGTTTSGQVAQYAAMHGMTYESAKQHLESNGFIVEDTGIR